MRFRVHSRSLKMSFLSRRVLKCTVFHKTNFPAIMKMLHEIGKGNSFFAKKGNVQI